MIIPVSHAANTCRRDEGSREVTSKSEFRIPKSQIFSASLKPVLSLSKDPPR
jgi:hypothetical protein